MVVPPVPEPVPVSESLGEGALDRVGRFCEGSGSSDRRAVFTRRAGKRTERRVSGASPSSPSSYALLLLLLLAWQVARCRGRAAHEPRHSVLCEPPRALVSALGRCEQQPNVASEDAHSILQQAQAAAEHRREM